MLTLKDSYKDYEAEGGKLSYKDYRSICERYNVLCMDRVIEHGERLDLGANLARIYVIRIERNFNNPTIDWAASKAYKQELIEEGVELYSEDNPSGQKWFIYYTDEWYTRFYWEKRFCKVKNKSAYRFDATRGKKGNKEKLTEHLRSNDLSYLKYTYHTND